MSDAKPYTLEEWDHFRQTEYMEDCPPSRVRATVTALDAAQAEVAALRARVAELEAVSDAKPAKHAPWCAGTPRPEKGEGVVYNCNCAEYRAMMAALDAAQAEVTALRAEIQRWESKQADTMGEWMKAEESEAALRARVAELEP